MNAKCLAAAVVSIMAMTAFACVCFDSDSSDASAHNLTYSVGQYVDLVVATTDDDYDSITLGVERVSGSPPPGMSLVELPSNYVAGYPQTIYWNLRGTPTTPGTYHVTYEVYGEHAEYGDWTFYSEFNITIVASTATVTYNGNGGTASKANDSVNIGSSVVLPSASKPYYNLAGWFTAASGGTRVGGAGDSYTVNGDTTLFAQYNVIPVSFTTVQDTAYVVQGSSFSYTAGTSPAAATLTVSGASWLTVSGNTVAGTASQTIAPGTYHVTLTASYGTQSAVQTFDIIVVEKLIFESVPTGGIIAIPV